MKRSPRMLMFLVCLGLGLAVTSRTQWQADAQEVAGGTRQQLDDGIPAAAMLTDRGRELAENLRHLRRTRANLGGKHPTLPVIEEAIAETEQQLRAWLPNESGSDNPFKHLDSQSQRSGSMGRVDSEKSVMNENDLRQLVLRLHARIEQLELRVRTLEGSQE